MTRKISVERQLSIIEADPAIPLESVDYSVQQQALLADGIHPLQSKEWGDVFAYFGRVETESERNALELAVLLPHADEHTQRFIDIWEIQEGRHGQIFDNLLDSLGHEPQVPDLNNISRTIKVGGLLAHIPGMHDVMLHTYLTTGATHEKLTAIGYELVKKQLAALGETALLETAIVPIKLQESKHYAYYKRSGEDVRDRLAPWQILASRTIKTHTYAPVGAGTTSQKADFGGISETLTQGKGVDAFADPVQKVAQDLLVAKDDGLKLPPFVRKGLQEAVELHYERQRAQAI